MAGVVNSSTLTLEEFLKSQMLPYLFGNEFRLPLWEKLKMYLIAIPTGQ